jgi:hypothetical protein
MSLSDFEIVEGSCSPVPFDIRTQDRQPTANPSFLRGVVDMGRYVILLTKDVLQFSYVTSDKIKQEPAETIKR